MWAQGLFLNAMAVIGMVFSGSMILFGVWIIAVEWVRWIEKRKDER